MTNKALEIRAIMYESLEDGEVSSLPVNTLNDDLASKAKGWAVYEVQGQCLTTDFPKLALAEQWLANRLAMELAKDLPAPMNRAYYMDNLKEWRIHDRYYSQFAHQGILSAVKRRFGIARLCASKDKHFNDIPLQEWDNLVIGNSVFGPMRMALANSNVDPYVTLSDKVCLAKAAARMLKEIHS